MIMVAHSYGCQARWITETDGVLSGLTASRTWGSQRHQRCVVWKATEALTYYSNPAILYVADRQSNDPAIPRRPRQKMETLQQSKCTRRDFLTSLGAVGASLALAPYVFGKESQMTRTNVLLITVDDMDHYSLGATGCKIPGITPNIDALAAQGMLFEHAHITSAICQPCRSVLMTGRYPHRNGALGFQPINPDVPTLTESLRTAGYFNGIMGKVGHLAPRSKFCWDFVADKDEIGPGRDPGLYYKHSRAFLGQVRSADKPFFLMANSHDPHRPFPGSAQEAERMKRGNMKFPKASRYYKAEEVEVPGFLPDGIPDIRQEIAQYYSGVHRCDEIVGDVLRALKETGFEEDTLVILLSDNGMAFPYAKTNCYQRSTQTPFIARWPGRVKPNSVNRDDLVSGIDIMPTVLEAAGVELVRGMDGRSFLSLARGEKQEERDRVFTFITRTAGRNDYPMRCVRTKEFSYIFNAWSDGQTVFKNESQSGLTFKAMQAAAEHDEKVAARVKFFQYRVPEEFYDLQADSYELNNLIDAPEHKSTIDRMRAELLQMMMSTKDPMLEEFKKKIG